MTKRRRATHPMQPLVRDRRGVVRFKKNAIVDFMLDWCAGQNGAIGYPKLTTPDDKAPDLTTLAGMNFQREDWIQLCQLMGYSVDGTWGLSYMTNAVYKEAQRQKALLIRKRRQA